MEVYECTRCGYVTKEVNFDRCPFCGCDTKSEYQSLGTTDGGSRTDNPKTPGSIGYQGLFKGTFLVEPLTLPRLANKYLADEISRIPSIPLGLLLQTWYASLSPEQQSRYEDEMTLFCTNPSGDVQNLLPDQYGELARAKAMEIVQGATETTGKEQCCQTCTFSLGFSHCYFGDRLSPKVPAKRSCSLYVGQVDTEALRRRLSFSLGRTGNQ